MQTRPIEPARHAHDTPAPACAPAAWLQANGLPSRWAGRRRFVVLEAGFGLGDHFLATWDAWRRDPARCEQLCFVSVEPHPPLGIDLARAHAQSPLAELSRALLQAWPPLTPNLHLLDFEQGRVQLTLVLGEAATLLPALRLQADAVVLQSLGQTQLPTAQQPPQLQQRQQPSKPAWNPSLLKAVARLATPGATIACLDVNPGISPDLHASLRSTGFERDEGRLPDASTPITRARFAPRFQSRALPSLAVDTRHAVVVGAGLAGAAAAQALVQQGLTVTVLEGGSTPAQGASGNPAGLFHGTVNADDGTYARLYRAAALAAAAAYRRAVAEGGVPGAVDGLLRLGSHPQGADGLRAALQATGLPAAYVQALDAAAASALAGVPLQDACWFYPGGGWLSPAAWVQHTLQGRDVDLRCGAKVDRLQRDGATWHLLDAEGQTLAQSPLVVLANAADTVRLLAPLGHRPWPLRHSRGQVTHWSTPGSPSPGPSALTAPVLKLPVAGDGYALPLPQGLLCGATRQEDDSDPTLRAADERHNLQRLKRLTGIEPPAQSNALQGRVGWRLHADDRLPIAGAVPQADLQASQRRDQARLLPREAGLFVLTALGARGLTLAPLLARLVAAQATGAPWPLEQDLADAVDPARWIVRAARRQAGAGQAG